MSLVACRTCGEPAVGPPGSLCANCFFRLGDDPYDDDEEQVDNE